MTSSIQVNFLREYRDKEHNVCKITESETTMIFKFNVVYINLSYVLSYDRYLTYFEGPIYIDIISRLYNIHYYTLVFRDWIRHSTLIIKIGIGVSLMNKI